MRSQYRFFRLILLWITSLLLSSSEVFAGTQTAVTKDAAAIAALTQMIAATGWNPLNLPNDAVLAGTVLQAPDQASGTIILKMKGLLDFRCDVLRAAGVTSTIVNNGQAGRVLPDGTAQLLSPQDAASVWPVQFPFFSDLALAASSQSISVSYLGVEAVNSSPANKIQVTVQVQPFDPRFVNLATAQFLVWLDLKTALPLQLQYTILASDNPTVSMQVVRQFSNYQSTNGIEVALTQQEFTNGNLRYTLQLSTVNFNVGLTDTDFLLPSTQQGGL